MKQKQLNNSNVDFLSLKHIALNMFVKVDDQFTFYCGYNANYTTAYILSKYEVKLMSNFIRTHCEKIPHELVDTHVK